MVKADYVWEKFHSATRYLAAVDAPLHERLRYAWTELHRLDRDEVAGLFTDDERLSECVDQVYDGLDEGNGGVARLDSDEAEGVARCIVSVYDHVARYLQPSR